MNNSLPLLIIVNSILSFYPMEAHPPHVWEFQCAEHDLACFVHHKLDGKKLHFGAILAIASHLRDATIDALCGKCVAFAYSDDKFNLEILKFSTEFLSKLEQCVSGRKMDFVDYVQQMKNAVEEWPENLAKNANNNMSNGIHNEFENLNIAENDIHNKETKNANGIHKLVEHAKFGPQNEANKPTKILENSGILQNGIHDHSNGPKLVENGVHIEHKNSRENPIIVENGHNKKLNNSPKCLTKNSEEFTEFSTKVTKLEKQFFLSMINFWRENAFGAEKQDDKQIRHFFLQMCSTMHFVLMRLMTSISANFGIKSNEFFARICKLHSFEELNTFYNKFSDVENYFQTIGIIFHAVEQLDYPKEEMDRMFEQHKNCMSDNIKSNAVKCC